MSQSTGTTSPDSLLIPATDPVQSEGLFFTVAELRESMFPIGYMTPADQINAAAAAAAQATANAAIPVSTLGQPLGPVQSDATNKVPIANLPSAIFGSSHFLGTWNAQTNTPPIVSGTPPDVASPVGGYYVVSVGGMQTIDGVSEWNAGDWIIWNGTAWNDISGQVNPVSSVAGLQGAVTSAQLADALAGAVGLSVIGGQLNVALGNTADTAAAGNDPRITGALQGSDNLSDVANAATALRNLDGQPALPAASGSILTGPGTPGGNPGAIPAATAGRMLLDSSTAWTPVPMSGDATLAASGAIAVTKTNGRLLTSVATSSFNAAGGPPMLDSHNNFSGQTIAQNLSAFPTLSTLVSYVPPVPAVFADKQVFNVTNFSADGDGGGGTFVVNATGGGIPDQHINVCPTSLLGAASTTAPLFIGDGSTATFSGMLANCPIVPQSANCPTPLTISCGGVIATDQGDTLLAGAGVTGTINYLTGAYSLTYSVAPSSGANGTNNAYSYANSQLRVKRQYDGNKVFAEWFGYQAGMTADIGQLFKLVPQYSELHFNPGKYTMASAPSSPAISTLVIRGNSTVFLGLTLPTNVVAFDWSWPNNLINGSDNNGNNYKDTCRVAISPLEGVTLIGPSATAGTSIGIRLGSGSSQYFTWPRNFAVQGFVTGFQIVGNSSFLVGGENLVLKANGTNLVVNYAGASNSGENIRFSRCMIDNAYVAGFNITSALVTFDGCSIDYNYVHGIATSSTVKITNGSHIESAINGNYPNTPASNTYSGAWFSLTSSLMVIDGSSEWYDTTPAADGPIEYPYILLDPASHLIADFLWGKGAATLPMHDVPLCSSTGYVQGRIRSNSYTATPFNGLYYVPLLADQLNLGAGYLMPVNCELPFQTITAWTRGTAPLYGTGANTNQNSLFSNPGAVNSVLNGTFACTPGQVFNAYYYDKVITAPIADATVSVTFLSYGGLYVSQAFFPIGTGVSAWTGRYFNAVAPAGAVQAEIQWTASSGSGGTGSYGIDNLMMWFS